MSPPSNQPTQPNMRLGFSPQRARGNGLAVVQIVIIFSISVFAGEDLPGRFIAGSRVITWIPL